MIIGLDSDDLYGTGDSPFADDLVAGHAVVITGIDDEAGVVYINDPGFPDGAGLEIPLDQFEDAWEDSDNTVVTATGGGEVGATGVPADEGSGDEGGALDAARRILFLPLNFVAR